jgi:hypothetical protein
MADPPFSAADFHNVVHKQIVNAAFETLADAKLDWNLVAPFLDAAHEICRADFQEGARLRLHATRGEGGEGGDSEAVAETEAFLSIAVADREDGETWLSESYWLSDIALADGDPEEVRRLAAGIERSLAKVKAWLAEREATSPGGAESPPG